MKSNHRDVLLSDIGEKDLIDRFLRSLTDLAGQDPLSDDCQFLNLPEGHLLCVSTDRTPSDLRALDWGLMSLEQYGYYSVVTNLSDIAAVGASPIGYLLNLGLPKNLEVHRFEELLSGVKAALEEYGVGLSGGDTKEHDVLNLVGVALGSGRPNELLYRRNVKATHSAHYVGPGIGLAPAAFAYFAQDNHLLSATETELLLATITTPRAMFAEAQRLQCSCACIDNSDGIGASLLELSRSSGVGFNLQNFDALIHPLVFQVAELTGLDPVRLALGGGGDFGLVFTCEEESADFGIKIGSAKDTTGLSIDSIDMTSSVSVFNHFMSR